MSSDSGIVLSSRNNVQTVGPSSTEFGLKGLAREDPISFTFSKGIGQTKGEVPIVIPSSQDDENKAVIHLNNGIDDDETQELPDIFN